MKSDFTKVALAVAVLSISYIWRAWVFLTLWAWFAVPTFGLPALSLAAAIGIRIIVDFVFVAMKSTASQPTDKKALIKNIVTHDLAVPIFALALGFIVKQFM